MGRSTMNFLILALLATEISSAATKADSILAFTGNRDIRAVWVRDAWCDANYKPIASHAGMHKTQLMVYSTSETSGPRELNPEDELTWAPCITRKDGSQVVWADVVNKCAWIRDFNCTSARRNLNLGTDFDVLSVDYNKATGAENMYIKSVDKNTVYRIPFTSSYTADLTKKTAVITGTVEVDGSFSVSGDGKMAGAALPWPNTYIYNMETKQANMRHTGQFGCNCNIAPDNSYRFFHFGDDHNLIHMFEANLVNSFTDISTTNVPLGNNDIGQSNPRWTSNVNFMSIVSPNHTDDPDDWTFENDANLGWSAAKVQQMPLYMAGAFYLGKFGADFKSVTWITISGGDRRINDGTAGMVWVAENPGSSSLTNERAVVDNKAQAIVYARSGSITATFLPMEKGTVSILAPTGRLVAASSGVGSAVCAIGNQPAGTYIVKVLTASRGASTSTLIVQ